MAAGYDVVALAATKRVILEPAGGVLLLGGIALLVLPGPGLLLVLAGLLVLAVVGAMRRVILGLGGGVLLVGGIVLVPLPGPGLLLVLAGLLVLAKAFPALDQYVDPVRDRAMKAAEDSVSSPIRSAGSVLAVLALTTAGVVWGLNPGLPLGGWGAGTSLVLSGIILLTLLVWSYQRVRRRRERADSQPRPR